MSSLAAAPIPGLRAPNGELPTVGAQIEAALAARVARGELALPVLPEAASRVLALANSPRCDSAAIVDVIRRDPSLSANVVKLASSPAYSGAVKVGTVAQAIARLGLTTIVQLTLAATARARLFAVSGFDGELRAAFRHAVVSGLFAQEIARFRRAPVDVAFTAGLLHDFGTPVLIQACVDLYREFAAPIDRAHVLATCDHQHAAVAGALAAAWGFPDTVVAAVRDHHAPRSELASTIALADGLAHSSEGDPITADHDPTAHAIVLNLYPEDLAVIARKAAEIHATAGALA